jgi:hypothetical protein
MKTLFVVLAAFVASVLTGCGSESVMYNADKIKSPKETGEYFNLLSKRIESIQADISALESQNISWESKNQTLVESMNDKYAAMLRHRISGLKSDINDSKEANRDFRTTLADLSDTIMYRLQAPRLIVDIGQNDSLLAVYQAQLSELEGGRGLPWSFSDSNAYAAQTGHIRTSVNRNDSLVAAYQKQLIELQKESNSFLLASANKTAESRFVLASRNAGDFAGAYVEIKNIDLGKKLKASPAASADSGEKEGDDFIGIVQNNWYKPVIAQVTGPNDYYREFSLTAHSSKVFTLPASDTPVKYTTKFVSAYGARSTSKDVGPNIVYYNEDGKAYSYMATQLSD